MRRILVRLLSVNSRMILPRSALDRAAEAQDRNVTNSPKDGLQDGMDIPSLLASLLRKSPTGHEEERREELGCRESPST